MVVVICGGGRGGVVDGESESRGKVSSSEADILLSFDQASIVRSVMNLCSLDDGSMKFGRLDVTTLLDDGSMNFGRLDVRQIN